MPGEGTTRTLDGRLFPLRWIGPFSISAQGGRGYLSSPRAELPRLEDYRAVEVLIGSERPEPVDPHAIGLPEHLARFFPALTPEGPALGGDVPVTELDALADALLAAAMANPNAGYPSGTISWPGRTLFHGASEADAHSIVVGGVDLERCERGYFGQAFYLAEDEALARSNYADVAEDGGAVVAFEIAPGARILDLRHGRDARLWDSLSSSIGIERRGAHLRAAALGVDGVYDRSFGGLAIYDARVLRTRGIRPAPEADAAPAPRGF